MNTASYILSSILLCTSFTATAYTDNKENDLIEDALSAAPAALRDKVTVVGWDKKVLKKGTNNYTCFPTLPI